MESILVIYRLRWTDDTGVDRDICIRKLALSDTNVEKLKSSLTAFALNIKVGALEEDLEARKLTVVFHKRKDDGLSATDHRQAFNDLIDAFIPALP